MELNPEQRQAVTRWVTAGVGLSDIQKRIADEFGIPMTYMDVRFLVIDLGVEPKDKAAPKPAKSAEAETAVAADAPRAPGGVVVDVDAITKPGALVSGTVVFSDGVKATWFLDQMGRLALDAGQPGYKPGKDDLQVFQQELRTALERRGF